MTNVERKHAQCKCRIHDKEKFIAEKSKALEESFVIHKEPFVDRHKWSLTMWYACFVLSRSALIIVVCRSQLNVAQPLVRTWFELENCNPRDPRMVYLLGSFFNWECAVLMTEHEDGKWGVWIDLPPGRCMFPMLKCARKYNNITAMSFAISWMAVGALHRSTVAIGMTTALRTIGVMFEVHS